MGPRSAAETLLERAPAASSCRVTRFGSLAATGKGHLTEEALREAFRGRRLEIVSRPGTFLPRHPSAMTLAEKRSDS